MKTLNSVRNLFVSGLKFHAQSELIQGCGSVITSLFFLQHWLKISSFLPSYFYTVQGCGAYPVILCVILLFAFRSLYSTCLIPLISVDLVLWRDLISIGRTKLGIFYSRFYRQWLSHLRNEMQKSDNDSVQTCAQEPETTDLYTAVPRLAHRIKSLSAS